MTQRYYRKREMNKVKRENALKKSWASLSKHEKFLVGDTHPEAKNIALKNKSK